MTAQLDCLGLVTTDLAASLAFYRSLGLDIPAGAENQPHVEAPLPGGLRLMWDTLDVVRSLNPDWTAPSGSPRIALAFRCADPAEVDAVHERMVAAGHRGTTTPFDAPWGQRYASLLDPDGNGVDLYAPLG
ncbi:glyoxalase [Actinocatenispora thailandica]|uniref:Glyoxalase n=1 Tax=Actinocatenispora thailandica TaxID=227318 RepID=A0A7R7DQK3_9ACTN|nr:VOC family protein [Actinocatenispora thailandica]BCJ35937.1 glyoxalase [Actinocatenispora thailandica]